MKIVFLCGSLEHGADGVGDYTRTLATNLISQGHSALCISINDPYIKATNCCALSPLDHRRKDISTFRFSRETGWLTKFISIRNILLAINPDWVSLQYVPYSYGRNGLAFQFTCLSFLLKGPWQWHLMFHELWIGREKSLKKEFILQSQKILIKSLATIFAPRCVTTSINRYITLLSRIGIKASILPIHSSIPVVVNQKPLPLNPQQWIFVFFGSLDRQWQPEPFFSQINSARFSSGITQCLFLKLGRNSDASRSFWNFLSSADVKQRYPAFRFVDGGEQTEEDISKWLSKASFGMSMAPLEWIGKSSSVAAMIDHGLPVIVPKYPVCSDAPSVDNLLFEDQLVLIDSLLELQIQKVSKFPIRDSASDTASRLIYLLLSVQARDSSRR